MTTPSPYWPAITSVDADGNVAVDRFAMHFFLEPRACFDPLPVMRAIRQFLSVFSQEGVRYYVDDEGDAQPLGNQTDAVLEQRIAVPTRQKGLVEFSLVEIDASPYREYVSYFFDMEAFDGFKPERRIPLSFRLAQADVVRVGLPAVVEFMVSLTQYLPYTYAYAQPALTCEYSFLTALPYVRRYPGLDVAIASSVAKDIGDGPLGAYWINIFGAHLCSQLGSPHELKARLPEEVAVLPAGQGGLCVVLGKTPDIGDVNWQRQLPLYRQLAALLRPWLKVPRVTYFTDSDDMADRDAQVAWHQRFLHP